MKRILKTGVLVCATLTLTVTASLAQAHHSFAMYDTDTSISHTGKLTRFIPGANHAQIIFELVDDEGNSILDENGRVIQWGFETGGSAMIARQGVTVKDFPIGTFINVTVNPQRNGKPMGLLTSGIIKCGSVMPEGGCNADTGEMFMQRR